ncbi:transcriptional regulator [Cnuibacter physcomitrellae]|uniref:Uncharacterized protein n=1 Tax=Cnuibacter physcomitrellae TaxID=1619308 RepID=A0A1X9LQ48_9MICO|nr:helix-turn-helix transcriptional regulator [Cnuibacter physcomitrellae]ARJ05249.1 hypothetical protein B5808_08510 [Cnuibacter physcomitrellae]GGI35283.1 transcriptional regulator [Cnuibacter physcomitrellae]
MPVTRAKALGDYLRARRHLVSPVTVGIPVEPGRKVAGLRRSEVATLAGVSEQYYLRLEQGHDQRPSEQVLLALGRALQLDEYALDYLFRVAYAAEGTPAVDPLAEESITELLEHWSHSAVIVSDGNHDIVAVNRLAQQLGQGMLEVGDNSVVAYFSDEVREVTVDWEHGAANTAASLRFHSDPLSPRLQEIVDQLTASSPTFARLWPRHDAWPVADGRTQMHVEEFGTFDVEFTTLVVPGRPRHVLTIMFPPADSPAAAVFAYLAAR